jgi:hypothetical protein
MLYMLSPFVLDYISRSTALLLPWAGLGWMLGFTILALRTRQWRWAAAFAIVTCAVGGVNATAILFVGVAPVLWILYVAFLREVTWKTAIEQMLRIGVLSGIVSLWWASGLWAEGAYGLNVLKYTETIPTVTATSSSAEVWRGLGYWYFYGWDKIQPWTLTASGYIAHAFPILLSFALPVIALLIGFLARWRYRAFAVILIAAGVIFAVSAFPFLHPSPFGALLKAAADKSTVGLAMRSTNRVVPLIVLGLALLVASGITAIREVKPAYGTALAVIIAVLAAVNLAPLYQGNLIASNLEFPNTLPRYVTQTASYLNKAGTNRVLGIPGEDFGYYRWGVTMDPIWPGLLTRPWVSRGSVPVGEPASANLVRALDTSIQDGVFDPSTLAPFARLMSAGDVLVQNDQQYERFANAHPQALSQELLPTPIGLGEPVAFGPRISSNTLVGPIDDETQLGVPTGTKNPRSLVVYKVAHPRALARTEPTTAPLLLAGDGEGLLEATAFNLLDDKTPLFYSASLSSKEAFSKADATGSTYVVTDTNAKRLDSFGTLSDTYGYVETANDTPLTPDPSEQVLGMFPASDSDSTKTIALLSGAKAISATSYGYPTANFPEYQPFNAFDGDPNTAWEAGGVTNPINEAIQITLNHPVTTDHVTLLQPQFRPKNRHITKATITFDGGSPVTVALNASSLSGQGQLVTFAPRHFTTMRVTINAVTGSAIFQRSLSAVGFASINIGGVAPASESLRLPTDLLTKAGQGSINHRLVILTHRLRSDNIFPRLDPELSMSRTVELPSSRAFSVAGQVRIADSISDAKLNEALGRTTSTTYPAGSEGLDPVVQTNSSSRLAGDLSASSWAANDDNPATAWQPAFVEPVGQWLSTTLAHPLSVDHLNLRVINDGRHAVPTSVAITAGGVTRSLRLPTLPLGTGRPQGATTLVHLDFPTLVGTTFRLTITGAKGLAQSIVGSSNGQPTPVGIAELGLPGVVEPSTPTDIPAVCQSDLLRVDGHAVAFEPTGSVADALNPSASLAMAPCPSDGNLTTSMAKGANTITAAQGITTGWNIDELALSSAPGGAAATVEGAPASTAPTVATASTATPAMPVTLTHANSWSASGTVRGTGSPAWLVLGQSLSSGWHASLNGKDLGPPQLIDGYANGWKIPALAAGSTATVSFVWAPQHLINLAELLSLLGLLACIVIAAWPPRRRRVIGELDWVAPTLDNPLSYDRGETRRAKVLVPSLILGILAGLFTSPLGGIGALLIAIIGLRYRRSRALFFLGAAGSLTLAALYTVALQHRHDFPWEIDWPQHFPWANTLGWAALTFLVIDTAIETFRIRLRRSKEELAASEAAAEGSAEQAPAAQPAD